MGIIIFYVYWTEVEMFDFREFKMTVKKKMKVYGEINGLVWLSLRVSFMFRLK